MSDELPNMQSQQEPDGAAHRPDAEAAMAAEQERFRLLIDSATDYAIFTMAPDGRVDSWNAGAERMFGYTAHEIIGRAGAVLFTPEDRAEGVPERELQTAARDGRAADDRWHIRQNGERFYCSGVTTRLGPARAPRGFAKIARDTTAQRDAEASLARDHEWLEARVQQRTQELRREVEHRTAAQQQAVTLLQKLVSAQEDERARIARHLHDHLGQQLTALRLALERHRSRACADSEEFDRALALARNIDAEVDFLAWDLRPAVLDDLGLAAALPRFLREWSEHHDIQAEFRAAGMTRHLMSPETEVTFYRIAQEALHNVAKHAHARRVDVILEFREGSVLLVIEDDGIGFDAANPPAAEHRMGLVSMRERAGLVGATLQIESTPGEGTAIFVRVQAQPAAGEKVL